MKTASILSVALLGVLASSASAQLVLFDFNNGPQFTSTPVDQISGGIRAHFTATGQGFSIQNTQQVIGMLPTGFSGLGMNPNSVFIADLIVSFFDASTSSVLDLSSVSFMIAPQELACDTSSTIRMYAYHGTNLVTFVDATAPGDVFTWPTITPSITSAQPFDNIVVHFQAGPPSGGDWGPIFVADNLRVTPVPEPAALLAVVIGLSIALLRRRRN